jgi:sugar phosphate isomerase/epimerase
MNVEGNRMDRRRFLTLSLAAFAGANAPRLFADAQKHPIGLQVYSVRKLAEKDLPTLLSDLHKIGYQELELYWNLYSRPARELRKMIDDHGLRAPSGHLDYDGLDSKLDYARELGLQYVICPMLPKSMWNSLDDFKKAADQFNRWGEKAKSMGMRFGFHNHNYEFRKLGDTTGFDTIVSRTDPKLVCLELDCYWLTQAGRDPAAMIAEHADRVRLIHVKDRKPGFPTSQQLEAAAEHFTEVGTGTIDWKKVLAAAEKAGVQHYFVEQDEIAGPPLQSLTTSYRNLRSLLA